MSVNVSKALKVLREAGVSESKPIIPDAALRFRGIGPKTLPLLEETGLVRLDDFADLPTRMGNLLRRAGYNRRDEVVEAIGNGDFFLDRKVCYYRRSPGGKCEYLRNCGPGIFGQVKAWAGFDADSG